MGSGQRVNTLRESIDAINGCASGGAGDSLCCIANRSVREDQERVSSASGH